MIKLWETHLYFSHKPLINMASNPPFDRLEEAPAGEAFGGFLREESQKKRFGSLKSWLADRELKEEEEMLASFTYISGGFTTTVPEALFENGITTLEATVSSGSLELLLDGTYSGTHRRRPDKTPDALRTFHRNISPTFTGFVNELQETEDPFNYGMSRLTPSASNGGVESFGRLAAFDWMETLVRVHDHDWLAPSVLRRGHLTSSGGPPAGFKEVFNVTLGEEYTKECLEVVEQFAKNQLNLPDTKRVFEIESAFCNFQKHDEGDRKAKRAKC